MSLRQEWKVCPRCHKKYCWNPDVGQIFCPHCRGAGDLRGGKTIFDTVRKKFPSSK